MQLSLTEKKSIRKNFGKLEETLSIPNLIEVQKNSYSEFLNLDSIQVETERKASLKLINTKKQILITFMRLEM